MRGPSPVGRWWATGVGPEAVGREGGACRIRAVFAALPYAMGPECSDFGQQGFQHGDRTRTTEGHGGENRGASREAVAMPVTAGSTPRRQSPE
jgi:hypothetical protein